MCGFGDKDRRPLAPAAVAKMVVKDRSDNPVPVDDIDISFFVVTVDLWSEDGSQEMNLVLHPNSGDRYVPAHMPRPKKHRGPSTGGRSTMGSPSVQTFGVRSLFRAIQTALNSFASSFRQTMAPRPLQQTITTRSISVPRIQTLHRLLLELFRRVRTVPQPPPGMPIRRHGAMLPAQHNLSNVHMHRATRAQVPVSLRYIQSRIRPLTKVHLDQHSGRGVRMIAHSSQVDQLSLVVYISDYSG
jgi:hypothetical protein